MWCLLFLYVAAVFGGKAQLSPDYTLEWDLDQASSIMTFNVTVKKAAWVGLGFHAVGSSLDEAMVNADCIIATYDSKGKVLVDDYYSLTFESPQTDVLMGGTDDVLSFAGSQADGTSKFEFKRKLTTPDTFFDVPFSIGPAKVIWAIGTSNDFAYHSNGAGNRGSQIIDLWDKDVCGPIKTCKPCLANSKCVFCAQDNLCYDKSNPGNCGPMNSTCTSEVFACDNQIPDSSLPEDFCATEWIGGLGSPRQLVHADNGDVLVLEASKNQVTVIWEEDGVVRTNPLANAPGINHGVAINNQLLYASSPTTVYRWRYIAGQRNPLGTPEVVINNIPSGGHFTRTMIFDSNGLLHVVIGSASNVDTNTARTVIRQFNVNNVPNGGLNWNSGVIYAQGLRNTAGLGFDSQGRLWGVDNGVDSLNRPNIGGDIHNNNPSEEVNLIHPAGNFYGYPYCWSEYNLPVYGQGAGTQWAHPNFMNDGTHTDAWCRTTTNVVPPVWNLPAHTAPLDIKFYYGDSFPPQYKGGAFVALHGSWNRQPPAGYRVVFLPFTSGLPTGQQDFFKYAGSGERWPSDIRPVSISFGTCGTPPQDCMYLTSDASGQIIKITYSPTRK